jgi:pimeloyl-ACP methyl ester carboxylesterase
VAAERDVTFESDGLRLAGAFLAPDGPGPFATVLMLPGSGQTDRDDNAPRLRIDAFPQIAAYLGLHGFASFRFDKRGVGSSEGDYWSAGFGDRATDATAALSWLRSQEDVDADRVFVLGHSEGALLATRLAGAHAPVAGAILLAGTAHSGEETLIWQAQRIAQGMQGFNKWLVGALHIDVAKSQRKALDKIKRTDRDWMRVQLVHDPSADLANLSVPVLAITGSKDIQVDPTDLKIMSSLVRSDFESHEVPDLTHILRADAHEPSLANYKGQAQRPVDRRVLELIGDWLKRRS